MTAAADQVRPFHDFLLLLVAPTIWFAHFSFLYAAETVICIEMAQGLTIGWTVLITAAAALTAITIYSIWLLQERSSRRCPKWIRSAALISSLLSAMAIAWCSFPAAMLAACANR
jgi:hypothetical protein